MNRKCGRKERAEVYDQSTCYAYMKNSQWNMFENISKKVNKGTCGRELIKKRNTKGKCDQQVWKYHNL
jgi:hypothetical protein